MSIGVGVGVHLQRMFLAYSTYIVSICQSSMQNGMGTGRLGVRLSVHVAIKIKFPCKTHRECKFGVNVTHSQPYKLTLF